METSIIPVDEAKSRKRVSDKSKWKKEVTKRTSILRSWHFKFSEAKRFILTKNIKGNVVLKGEAFYNSDVAVARSILKKGKNLSTYNPPDIPKGIPLKPEKLEDIRKLLVRHFGEEWSTRDDVTFYNFENNTGESIENEQEPEQYVFCELREDETNNELRI
ncbi:unnamed protein product [Psylliodes chrysocephalus]|uniref:Uncharacterized protein n=1 Tax=Psylliodes chrysocephalus TaxID=3402493 RepID=A0A9P0CU18_9CUCU|nr:unnamed protein product [Psylliodes chrysocephala]